MNKRQTAFLIRMMALAFISIGLFLPGLIGAGDLQPPGPPTTGTMKTMDQIPPTWSQILPSSERFELVLGGEALLDKETGLVWAKDANIGGGMMWDSAMVYCQNLSIGSRKGWRLPTVEELASLVDPAQSSPALPSGHPFINVQSSAYWSANASAFSATSAWGVYMDSGSVINYTKTDTNYVWPVRGQIGK